MSVEKDNLRARMRELRRSLHSEEKDEKIATIALKSFPHQSVFLYLSAGSEVSTKIILKGLLARGTRVCVPRVAGDKMFAVPYPCPLEKGPFGLLQPTEGEDEPCELILAPLLAADGEGFRLGNGGGYYDRYLASHRGAEYVGLMYEGQAFRELPRDPWDIPLHKVVTEKGVLLF